MNFEHVNREEIMEPKVTYGVVTAAPALVVVEFVVSLPSSNTR